ncbi:MAG TPA: LacI family DNA-binding transcriptional regulator [Abditibacteriaceae bacterium]|jgi:DNA-binding LacI/PurR family transcriptional regulator
MLKNTRKTVTLREVAALAGMDKATVSRALSGKGYVSQQRRDAALKAAQELGFQPDLYAQHLAQGRNHNFIGLLPSTDLGVLSQQTSFIVHRLDELNLEVQAYNVPQYVSHFERKQVSTVNKVRRQRPGAIMCGTPLVPEALHELRHFMQEGGVVTGYGEKMELDCDQVCFDLSLRSYLAARHLLELGHRELGYCFHSEVIDHDSMELAGFARAMEEFGAPVQEEWLFCGGNYEEGGARLAEAFLSWTKKPTGICIVNDVSASTFVTTLFRNGIHVPDDVSVVGFDNVQAARYALVPLTTVSYPLEAIGRHAVELTHSRLKGYHGPPRMVEVESELIIRSSTARYRRKNRS